MEAVVKLARTTRHPWQGACDANMDPRDFMQSLWFEEKRKSFLKRQKRKFKLADPLARKAS